MLDKLIPYYNVIMHRKSGTSVPEVILPEGYSFVNFSAGDECHWAEIEASVGEFTCKQEAESYFKSEYLPYLKELERRLIFVQTEKGEKIATYTIWWVYSGELRVPSVHWVAVKSEYQGLGLGKAVVFKGIEKALSIEGDRDIYLHTQTCSYKAIGIYMRAGFRILEKGTFGGYENDYEKAMPVLMDKMKRFEEFAGTPANPIDKLVIL